MNIFLVVLAAAFVGLMTYVEYSSWQQVVREQRKLHALEALDKR